jgi:hypothetical protein
MSSNQPSRLHRLYLQPAKQKHSVKTYPKKLCRNGFEQELLNSPELLNMKLSNNSFEMLVFEKYDIQI